MKKISVYLSENALQKLKKLAVKEGRTYSELIRESVNQIIRDYERKRGNK